jgi:2-enoate reductase
MTEQATRLMEPIQIGSIEVKNRLAMAPMGIVGLVNPDGSPGPRAVDYFLERAKGGVGLIITGLFKVEAEIEQWTTPPSLITPKVIPPFSELAESIHALGGRIFVQLTAGFGRVLRPRLVKTEPLSASAIPYFWDPEITCRALETEEVEQIVRSFGVAAEILAAAGIDGVELHGHEGYLFDQFATPVWNQRTDKYGGDLQARLRFPLEVLKEIKSKAGADFPVQYRFGVKHYMKGLNSGALPGEPYEEAGRRMEEGLEMAGIFEKAGFDSLHVDAGCYDSHYWPHPPTYQEDGCMVDMAAAVKKVVDIPVVAVGKLASPEVAASVVAEGKADMVALGRGLLADPEWMRKVEKGKPETIRPCISCFDGCLGRIHSGRPLSCALNPTVGRERAYALKKVDRAQKVLIAGGGVAGMEAARVAAIRGHEVVLFEKTGLLGGCLVAGSRPAFKKDVRKLLEWYISIIKTLGIDIQMGVEVTADLIGAENPETVILANGANPVIPPVCGEDQDMISVAADVLSGARKTGERVMVVGGGLVGCETALWLAQQNKKVTLVEMLPVLMGGKHEVPKVTKEMTLDLLRYHRVDVHTGTTLTEVCEDSATVVTSSGKKKAYQTDSIVLAMGLVPDQRLYRSIVGKRSGLFLIGDAREARNIMGAVWDAYEVARSI